MKEMIMLEIGYISMWVDKIVNKNIILLLILMCLLSYNNIAAQQEDKNFLFPMETSFIFL